MPGRKGSMTAQLSKTARRFSAAIAPQFTKIDQLLLLQKLTTVTIQIGDIKKLQSALEQYVLRNAVIFEPIYFDIISSDGHSVLQATLHPEEFVLMEGTKKVLTISMMDEDDEHPGIAKIRHPVSGMKVYELIELGGTIQIQSATDELDKCRIVPQQNWLSTILLGCGCIFTKESWSIYKEDTSMATVYPVSSFFSENSIRVDWNNCAENEVRVMAITFGLVQMLRVAFPEITHVLKELRTRQKH